MQFKHTMNVEIKEVHGGGMLMEDNVVAMQYEWMGTSKQGSRR